jgi:hypothetical protein
MKSICERNSLDKVILQLFPIGPCGSDVNEPWFTHVELLMYGYPPQNYIIIRELGILTLMAIKGG